MFQDSCNRRRSVKSPPATVALIAPAVRTLAVIVEAAVPPTINDTVRPTVLITPVLAIESHQAEHGIERNCLIAEPFDLEDPTTPGIIPLDDLPEIENGFRFFRVVATQWPEDEDAERLKSVIDDLIAGVTQLAQGPAIFRMMKGGHE